MLLVILWTALILGCTSPVLSPNKSTTLPVEIHVKRYRNSVDIEHDKIRIDPANIKFAKASTLNEWFELEHTASCNNEASTPKAVVMTLTHETPSKTDRIRARSHRTPTT